MHIESIYLENFKNIKQSTILFRENTTGIYGPNGSGKTSVIEAVKLLQLYVTISENKRADIIKNYFHAQCQQMKIGIVFKDDIEYINYEVTFENFADVVQVSSEVLSVKLNEPRRKYHVLLKVDNGSDKVQPIIKAKKEARHVKVAYDKSTYVRFTHFNSYFSLLNRNNQSEFIGFEKFAKVQKAFHTLVVSMLEDNAIAQLQLVLPLHLHTTDIHGVVPLKLNGGYHLREHVNILHETVGTINNVFHAIFPDRRLELVENDRRQSEDGEEVSITLFVVRGQLQIPIHLESTGTIKLIALLSALIAYIKYDDFILLIDELDAHIYEYLLSVLLEKMSAHARGQLIFTAHNLSPLERLNKNSIIFANETAEGVSFEYLKNVKPTTNIRDKYLRAIAYSTEVNIELSGMNESALDMIVRSL